MLIFNIIEKLLNYLERTSVWVERMGLEAIKSVLNDQQQVMQLNHRLDEALALLSDPWKEVINDESIQKEYYEKVKIPVTTN